MQLVNGTLLTLRMFQSHTHFSTTTEFYIILYKFNPIACLPFIGKMHGWITFLVYLRQQGNKYVLENGILSSLPN